MPLMPFGSPVLCQVCPPLVLDSTTPPVSPSAVLAPRRLMAVSPDIQHAVVLGQAKPLNSLPAGSPWASTIDHDSPPLCETKRAASALVASRAAAIQVSALAHERVSGRPGSEGTVAGDQSRPPSVL
jgi:hypothetical protein